MPGKICSLSMFFIPESQRHASPEPAPTHVRGICMRFLASMPWLHLGFISLGSPSWCALVPLMISVNLRWSTGVPQQNSVRAALICPCLMPQRKHSSWHSMLMGTDLSPGVRIPGDSHRGMQRVCVCVSCFCSMIQKVSISQYLGVFQVLAGLQDIMVQYQYEAIGIPFK